MVEITYHKEGDYYIPDLYLTEDVYEKNYLSILDKSLSFIPVS